MRRGEIWLANLDPTVGSEIRKIRPVLIISNDRVNKAAMRARGFGMITIIPLTSNTASIRTGELFFPKNSCRLEKDSKLLFTQIRSISISRCVECIGKVPVELSAQINLELKNHLALL